MKKYGTCFLLNLVIFWLCPRIFIAAFYVKAGDYNPLKCSTVRNWINSSFLQWIIMHEVGLYNTEQSPRCTIKCKKQAARQIVWKEKDNPGPWLSWLEHHPEVPGLLVWSLVGAHTRINQLMFLSLALSRIHKFKKF